MEREKVIRELEECIEHIRTNDFEKIPCWGNCQIAMMDALGQLKEQEAIEPDVYSEGTCMCGNCGTPVGYYPSGCSIPRKLSKYCQNCGREVKWECLTERQ